MSYVNPLYSSSVADLPPQMIPLSDKTQEWKEENLDALEQIGRSQYYNNLGLIENYEMVKGKFLFNQYFQADGYTDIIAQLTREFELPVYLRHYDIISKVVNVLKGEYQKRPDLFRVRNKAEEAGNEFERSRTDLLHKYVMSRIDAEVAKKMLDSGLDPDKNDFISEEDKQQYQQLIEQAKQQLTPPEIDEYMKTKWSQAGEIWGQHQIELDKQRFNLQEKELKEFEDMLVSDRCFRHFYLTSDGYNQETWNPIHTFFTKSPEVEYIENGDYVGRVLPMSTATIIDRYGYLMDKDQIDALRESRYKKDKKWNYWKGSEYVFDEYMFPFKDYPTYDILKKTGVGIPNLEPDFLTSVQDGGVFYEKRGLHFVTEAYWMSQMKIGKVVYIDPATGIKTRKFVDETFVVPEEFTELNSAFNDSDEINTITWTWVNQVWKGVKIALKNTPYGKDIYLDIKPLDFQFKGDFNPYGAKLPVCGQIFSIRNSGSMSLVDLMKPYQIFYNVMMNQLYRIAEREIGHFVVWDVNMFPDQKDWGGEKGYEKFMVVAKQFGLVPADTSVGNLQQSIAASGGYLPKEFNFDESARMQSRMNLALAFEQMALKQVGFNDYRLGSFTSEATASGIQQGAQQSYAQTESYFTNFSNYLRRCYEMDLAIAQYTQVKDKDIRVFYTKSDESKAFIKLLGTDILLANLYINVINSQEYIRQIESIRALGLNNNTSGANTLDLLELITTNSPEQIKVKIKESIEKQQEMVQRDQQLKQQELEQQKELAQAKMIQDQQNFERQLENNLDVAYVKEGSKIITSSDNSTPTPEPKDTSHENARLELDRQKMITDRDFKNRKLALQQAEMEKDLKIQQDKINTVKILKGKKT